MTISGGAGAPFLVSSNGSNNLAIVTAYPLNFAAGGTVTVQSQGATNHTVDVGYFNGGGTTATFSNTGAVLLDASATTGGTGGTINFQSYNAVISGPPTVNWRFKFPHFWRIPLPPWRIIFPLRNRAELSANRGDIQHWCPKTLLKGYHVFLGRLRLETLISPAS